MRFEDRAAIAEVMALYCERVDEYDIDAVAALFTPDCVTDYGPGLDAEKWFGETFKKNGGEIVQAIRVPLKNPDFAPFLQRVKDDKPDAVFVFVPSGFGAIFMKQFVEQGLDKAGVKLIGTVSSPEKARLAKQHGAWETIDYSREDIAKRVAELTGGKKVPVVYDGVGKDTWEASLDSCHVDLSAP